MKIIKNERKGNKGRKEMRTAVKCITYRPNHIIFVFYLNMSFLCLINCTVEYGALEGS